MKPCQSTGYLQQGAVILLLCFVSSLVAAASARALTGNHIDQCYDCHGSINDNRPLDTPVGSPSSYRNITTGNVKGNHRNHMAVAVTTSNACAPCHGTVPTTMGHRNGVITINGNINNSPSNGTYSKGTFFNQTTVPVMGSCGNVNCHFNTTTPTWGTATFQYTAPGNNDCNTCHGSASYPAPQDGSHPGNASNKHGVYYGTDTGSCVKCHSDHSLVTNGFAHASSAGHRSLILQGSELVSANYSLSGTNLVYPTYLTNPAASRNGTCSNLYCHSDGTKASGFTSVSNPQWGANGTLTCASCHGYTSGSASALGTNSHPAHVNSAIAARIGVDITCDKCHRNTTRTGTTIYNLANHVNKAINVNMSTGSYTSDGHAPGGSLGSCANTTCHNSGRSGVGSPLTVTWGTAAGANKCAICHGTGNAVGSPDYASGAAGSATANTHNTHAITKGISCSVCHVQTTTTGNTIVAGGGKHLDGSNQDVAFGPFNTQPASGAYTPGVGSKTCANTYCHFSATSQWGGARLNCRGCHGGDAASGTPIATGKHTAHTNPALNSSLGLGNGFQCAACHAKTVAFGNNTAISTQANHINGFIDYSGVRAGGSARYSTGTKLCTNIYCHSNGNPGAIVYVNPAAWNSATGYGCNGCHGASNPTTGAPDYVNGGAGTVTANSHPRHVAGAGISDTKGCANCHGKTVDQATAGKFKDYTAVNYHLNGAPNLYFKNIGGKTGTWSGSTCSNTYCHGTGPSAAWGSASLACNACHSANNALPGAHQIHVTTTAVASSYTNMSGNISSATSYRFSCAACHSSLKGALHANGPANANGPAEVFFGFTTATLKGGVYNYGAASAGSDPSGAFSYTAGGSAAGSCNNTYCHSNGQGGNGLATVAWNTTASSGTCVQCHDTRQTGATATGLSGKHDKHMNPTNNAIIGLNNGLNCIDCHAKTVSGNTAIANKANHVNKFVDYSSIHGGGSAKYNATTKQCTNIYCHSNGNPGAIVYVNPAAWNSATSYGCNGCHGTSNPTTGAPDYANGGAGSATANSHPKHVAGAVDTTVCSNCHVKTASVTAAGKFKDYTAAGYHLSGTPNIIFNSAKAGASATWSQGSSACSNVTCHSNGQGVWTNTVGTGNTPSWGATGGCSACHGNATYTDYRQGAPLYVSGTPKPNAHVYHTDTRVTASALATQCANCHSTVTATNAAIDGTAPTNHSNNVYNVDAGSTFRDADQYATNTAPVTVTLGYTYNASPAVSSCSNVSCHPTGLGDANKSATVVSWNDRYQCSDCHKVDLVNTAGYHHAMRNYSASSAAYPTAVPQGDATTGANSNSRRCTMCHVDHRISSPLQNNGNATGRAANLRTSIATTPTTTTGYTNSDYVGTAGGSGGICISCHNSQLTKSTTRIKVETSSTKTVDIVFGNYSRSSHQYAVASAMKSTDSGGTFNANCSKCHNGRNGETAAFSSMTTAVHDNSRRRNYASIGGAGQVDGNDANFCYGCHKGATTKDYYNTATMSTRAKDTFNAFSTNTRVNRHNVNKYNGIHKPSNADETFAYISANKHVSCTDCHNPHAARFGNNSTAGISRSLRATVLAKVLQGAGGVTTPTWPALWTAPTQAAYGTAPVATNAEWKICFKCHSGANSNVATWGGTGAAAWTDLGLEFNPSNKSYHPVVQALPTAQRLNAAQLGNGWKPGDVMTCTDCHATDSTASKGPHGSAVKWMLAGVNKAWPYTTTAGNGKNSGTFWTLSNAASGTANGLFCMNCHPSLTTTNTPHSNGFHNGYECVGCHIRVPHGGKIEKLINTNSAGRVARYSPDGAGATAPYLDTFVKASIYNGYIETGQCYSTNGTCNNHNVNTTTAW